MSDLEQYRQEIDELDEQLVRLFLRRMEVTGKVGEYKLAHGMQVLDRERERRVLERRLGVWERWEEWRLAGVRLERLEPVPATFPQDGPARLERALERRSDAERALEQARQRLEQAREDLGSRVADRALLDCGERLRELAGRAASCRNALAAIPGLCADGERTLAALQRELAGLGPDWTAERVQRIGRPLSLREALERQAEQRGARSAVRRAGRDYRAGFGSCP